MLFKHTSKERGMWRGWLKNGQALELVWNKRGWGFAAGVMIHSDDNDNGERFLHLALWKAGIYIPLGIAPGPFAVGEEPQWSVSAASEFGLVLHWGHRRKTFDWPWSLHTLAYEEQLADGSWRGVSYDAQPPVYSEEHPYTYTLKSGKVQHRTATISKRRHVTCRLLFKRLGWPRMIRESIHIKFSDEVGERSGSWKGGVIGCVHDLLPGEGMLDCLRRMERERKF